MFVETLLPDNGARETDHDLMLWKIYLKRKNKAISSPVHNVIDFCFLVFPFTFTCTLKAFLTHPCITGNLA